MKIKTSNLIPVVVVIIFSFVLGFYLLNKFFLALLYALLNGTLSYFVLKKNGKKKVVIPTVLTAAPAVLEVFNDTEYADRLKATGVITSYICPLMYMNNPLCKKMPVITSSNKLRTYTSSRYYTDEQILKTITGGNN